MRSSSFHDIRSPETHLGASRGFLQRGEKSLDPAGTSACATSPPPDNVKLFLRALSTNSRWLADVRVQAAKQPSLQASATVISDRVAIVGLFPRAAAKNVLIIIGGRNENRADGPMGSILLFYPGVADRRRTASGRQRFERLSMTESEPGKAWSSLPTQNAVQGSCRLPCFAEHKGMLNHP